MAKLTTDAIRAEINSDTLSLRKGIYTAKWSYFYSSGRSVETCKEKITTAFSNAYIIDGGNHWHSFVGGCKTGSAQDTYFWVTFKL